MKEIWYECSVCHAKFTKKTNVCPNCGVRFDGHVDDDDFIFEAMVMDDWDEE